MNDVTIIDDGDGPNNFDRADNARRALDAGGYEPVEDTLNITLPTPSGDEVTVPGGYPIGDLVCDLMHLARRHELDIEHMLREAWGHYGSDCVEQAWKHDNGWENCLQDPANLPRAEAILRVCGVPEEHHEHVYRMTGLLPPAEEAA